MDAVRRFSLLATAGLLGIAVMLGSVSARPAVSRDAASSLSHADAYFDSTIVLARNARPRGPRGDELTVALGYLERMRLGLGSPFRLADEATRDPRLSTDMQPRVAWALLGRVRRGEADALDPAVLDGVGPWTPDGQGASGAAHVALIERAVAQASDPRAGELAVRLAYLIATARGTLGSAAAPIAAQVAALVRDRVSAAADVRDLLADASDRRTDALSLLADRRAARGFRVEQPLLAALSPELQQEAMNAVPALVRALDTLNRTGAPIRKSSSNAVMGVAFATRLAALGRGRPPQSPVVVTLGSRAHTPLSATNDETLAASLIQKSALPDSARRVSALAALSAAVALRTLAQQEPWFAGDTGPDATDLSAEFGLLGVSFARGVPAAWRPFYLRELQRGLRDVQRVFPTFAMDGLRVRFGIDPLPDSALAMHNPQTRTLELSILTSGGTLAHELAHDLDYQATRRLYGDGNGYSSDRAMQEKRGSLARSLRGLAEARLLRPFGPTSAPQVGRPAELFARGADWFVTSSLAQQGTMNGFLSAIEDALLAGYAAGAPTAFGTAGVHSLTSAIEAMTYVPDSVRTAFESQWSDLRVIDPVLLVRRTLETPVWTRPAFASRAPAAVQLPALHPELCAGDDSPAARVRESLLITAIDARAQGSAARRARYRYPANRPDWASSLLGAAPWAPDEGARVVDALRAAIGTELSSALPDQGVVPAVPPTFRSSTASCSAIVR
jgi:hypothetical protein